MTATVAQALTFEQKLDQLARVAIEVGLGLGSGQELVMTAPLESIPLARRITEQAYRAGASLVTTLYVDDEASLMRYRFAPDAAFDRAAWRQHPRAWRLCRTQLCRRRQPGGGRVPGGAGLPRGPGLRPAARQHAPLPPRPWTRRLPGIQPGCRGATRRATPSRWWTSCPTD